MTSLSFISVPDVTPILAQAAGAGGGSFMSSFGMMAVILGIFYFLLIRPPVSYTHLTLPTTPYV